MQHIEQIKISLDSYYNALVLVRQRKLWKLVLVSGLLYFVLVIVGFFAIAWGLNHLLGYILDAKWFINFNDKYTWFKWLFKIITFAMYASSFLLFMSLYKYIFLIVGSPLYAYISEKTESAITGKNFDFNFSQFTTDIIRGMQISLRNLFKQTSTTLLLLILSFVPFVGFICPFIIIYYDAYYYGFSMLDYSSERHKLSVKQSIELIKRNKGLAFGNGIVFYGLFLIPVIGIIIGAPLSVIAATLSYNKMK